MKKVDRSAARDLHPLAAAAMVILPILAWGAVLGQLVNPPPASLWVTPLVLLAVFLVGLLVLKPLLLALGAVLLTQMLWSAWRKKPMDNRLMEPAAHAMGLAYAPVYGLLATMVGVWDGWEAGGMNPLSAGLLFGFVGFTHAFLVRRYTVVAAIAMLSITEGGESDSGGGATARAADRDPAPAPQASLPGSADDGDGAPHRGEIRR